MTDPQDSCRRSGQLLVLCANSPWNLLNFRRGLLKALQRSGYQLAAIVPPGDGSAELESMGVTVRHVPMDARGTSPIADLLLLWRYIAALRDLRPTAFLGFTIKPNIYGSLAARYCGVPVINNVTGLGQVFSGDGPLKRVVVRMYRLAFSRSATVFFQNSDDLSLFEQEGLVSSGQAALIPGSGIDTDHFVPKRREEGGRFTFLFAARLLWDKGIGEFAEAAKRIRSRRSDVRFQILGILQPEGPAAVSRRQIDEWQSEGIDYLGDASDVRPALSGADCVVLPSRYREGVPRVLLESSSMAIPVITTDVPGCRDAVVDGVTGFLCRPASVESLQEAMERMLDASPADRLQMGDAARKNVEHRFREEIVHDAYIGAVARATAAGNEQNV